MFACEEDMGADSTEAGPVYVVFGATGGIGSELCRRLSKGARLLLVARESAALEKLAGELGAQALAADATNSEQVEACMSRAVESYGQIDGVASCVGSLLLKPAHRTSDMEWSNTIALNLTSSFWVVRAAVRAMSSAGGAIALVASAAARVGLVNHEAIAAAKAGVMGLVRSAAATYARQGIRVNCVAPGLVRTPLTAALTEGVGLEASLKMHPLRRIGEPADVANALAWLLAPEASWVTGQVLGVDGGLADLRSRPGG